MTKLAAAQIDRNMGHTTLFYFHASQWELPSEALSQGRSNFYGRQERLADKADQEWRNKRYVRRWSFSPFTTSMSFKHQEHVFLVMISSRSLFTPSVVHACATPQSLLSRLYPHTISTWHPLRLSSVPCSLRYSLLDFLL